MVATLDRERQRSQEDLKELSSQLVGKCAVIEQLESELKEVRSVVSFSETTHLSLTSELKTLQEEKASLVEKLEEVRSVQEEIMLHKLSREVELLDRQGVLQASLSQSEGDVLALTAERQDMLLKIGDLERMIIDMGERNRTLEQQLEQCVVELDGLKAEIIRSRDQMKLSAEALTSSEASLKAMEEVAWHAKAEAGELLFALEQERSSAGTVTTRLVDNKQQLLDRQEELHALLQMRSNEVSAAAIELENAKVGLSKANQQIKLQSQE
jgi:chromosome segregation ATPase